MTTLLRRLLFVEKEWAELAFFYWLSFKCVNFKVADFRDQLLKKFVLIDRIIFFWGRMFFSFPLSGRDVRKDFLFARAF